MSAKKSKLKCSPFLESVTAYRASRPPVPIDLRLDGNEGRSPAQTLMKELLKDRSIALNHYPDASMLEKEIASTLGVAQERVLVTAGGDDAIERVLRAFLYPGREIILPSPTFEMFERYIKLAGGTVIPVLWHDGAFPIDAVLKTVSERTAVVVVVTPNSPNGCVAGKGDLIRISKKAPNAVLLLDLAYTEFADVDLTKLGVTLPNTVIIRSLSKAWGCAGLRVGYAVGSPEIISLLRAVGHPYAVSSLSLKIALLRMKEYKNEVRRFVSEVKKERSTLSQTLLSLGCPPIESQANFVLARFHNAEFVRNGLASYGIAVRIFPTNPLLKGYLRITLPGDKKDFSRLKNALETIVAPKAIIFDARKAGIGSLTKQLTRSCSIWKGVANKCELLVLSPDKSAQKIKNVLRTHKLEQLFDVITLSDVHKKSLDRAWVLSDSERGIAIAKESAMLPIGFVSDTQKVNARNKFYKSGTAIVIDDLKQFKEFLQ